MKTILISTGMLLVFALGVYWVYEKYNLENNYINARVSDDSGGNILERLSIGVQRQLDLETEKDRIAVDAYSRGEISFEEYQEYVSKKAEDERKEEEKAFAALANMYDPDDGMLRGVGKMKEKSDAKKQQQIDSLEQQILEILNSSKDAPQEIIVRKLKMVEWIPIGHVYTDNEMSRFYEERISKIIKGL